MSVAVAGLSLIVTLAVASFQTQLSSDHLHFSSDVLVGFQKDPLTLNGDNYRFPEL